jgi:hypothetical protein
MCLLKLTHLLAVFQVVCADVLVVGCPAPVEDEDGEGARGEDDQPGFRLGVAGVHQAQGRAEQDQAQPNIQVSEHRYRFSWPEVKTTSQALDSE